MYGSAIIHEEIINRCRRGEKPAQIEIYKQYYKPVYNTCLRIINDTQTAEDLMQDSFIDAFNKINTYDGKGSFGAWIRRIAVNNSIDYIKRSRPMVSINDETANIPDDADTYFEDVDYKVEEIKRALGQMEEGDRVILSLYLLEGYDHEEISQILEITLSNTRTRYSRAKKRLLRTLAEEKAFKNFFQLK